MNMQWTDEQLAAITTRKRNLLVSAAAGSGKTALLIERIRRMIIEDKIDVDRLLVLTFTRAAAAEMKERLTKAMMEELEKEGADIPFILQQINRLPSASISTLHAFCNTIVREYFQEGGVDPEFVLGNDTELLLMRQEAMENVFEKQYQKIPEKGETPFSRLIDAYTDNRSDTKLKDLVETIYNFLATQPCPVQWCEKALEDLNADDVFSSRWGTDFKAMAFSELERACNLYDAAIEWCDDDEQFDKVRAFLSEEKRMILTALEALQTAFSDFYQCVRTITFRRLVISVKDAEIQKDAIKAIRKEIKDGIKAMLQWIPSDEGELLSQMHAMCQPMQDLIALTEEFSDCFKKMKEQRSMLDFNDLEQTALKILDNPAIARELQDRYVEVFLDEYQDTNDMQEAIIQKIIRKDNYFMVGDVKQSIYRFRLADPSIFIGKYHSFKKDDLNNRLILLNRNFRSCQGVIDSINSIFEIIMTEELGEVDYDEDAKLYKGLPFEGDYQKTQICLIEEDGDTEFTPLEAEARSMAKAIHQRVGTPFYDTKRGVERLLQYRDIGVLMRTVASRGEVFARIFTEMGIPVYFDGASQYYESTELTVMLNLLSLIDNRHQDIPLLGVMTSPIGDFTAGECAAIRLCYPDGMFWQAAEQYAETQKDALAEKLSQFYHQIETWQEASLMFTIEDFLWKVYLESGYYNFVAALPGGKQRVSNLRVLLRRASEYKQSTLHGLFSFIRYVERMKNYHYDMSPPGVLSENENVVRITTIHKSKGLEFPVVFLAGMGQNFNKQEKNYDVLLHKDLGICPKYINLELRGKTPTLASSVCREKGKNEKLSEEMRLLYVAMTRARDQLILTGTVKDAEKMLHKWEQGCTPYHFKKAQNFLDWIMPVVMNTKHTVQHDDENWKIENAFFEINIAPPESALQLHSAQEKDEMRERPEVASALYQEIDRRMGFCYPYPQTMLPSKMSVTALKQLKNKQMHFQEIPERTPQPRFMFDTDTVFTPAEKGSALHFMMQHLALSEYGQSKDKIKFLEAERQRLVDMEMMEEALAQTVDLRQIHVFFKSEIGQRLMTSKSVYREKPFNYQIRPEHYGFEYSGTVTVQGMIDCFFEEDGQWVLLDYKTDRYTTEEEKQALIKQYQLQIDLYAQALEELTGKDVKAKYLCLIKMGNNFQM